MAFETSAEQYRPIEVQQTGTAALLPTLYDVAASQNKARNGAATPNQEEAFFSNFSFDQIPSIFGASEIVAWDPRSDYQSLQQSARRTDIVRQISMPDVAKQAEHALFPLRGQEDAKLAQVTAVDTQAWEHAVSALPQLAGTGVTGDVLKAIVRNELHFYDPKDARDDLLGQTGKDPGRTATLGFAQISQKGIAEFERDIPEFKQFLESKGYTGPGHELRALEDPRCAPMIVAAKLASLAKAYEAHNEAHPDQPVKINALSLIYGYNADVQARSEGGNIVYESMPDQQAAVERLIRHDLHKVYPTSNAEVLNTSHHVASVLEQLQIIESQQK